MIERWRGGLRGGAVARKARIVRDERYGTREVPYLSSHKWWGGGVKGGAVARKARREAWGGESIMVGGGGGGREGEGEWEGRREME